MGKKIKVVVLMGGKTPEHEVSLVSGKEVVRNLPKKYEVLPVVISRTGQDWNLVGSSQLLSLPDPMKLKGTKKDLVSDNFRKIDGVKGVSKNADVVFIAMHGPYGEDGTVQGMLDLAGISYTGPGVLASALGMDKIMFRKILKSHKLPFPKFVVVEKGKKGVSVFKALGKPPYVVKPHNQGSSVGTSLVKSKAHLAKALKKAFNYSDFALVDEYVEGIEVTCAILGNKNPKPLPLVEIVPKADFFDYDSKYIGGGADEIVPARISKTLTRKVQKMAIEVYKAIGCKGFSRVDFILRAKKLPVILEINTIPGLTPMSLLPKAAKAYGLSYSQLLDEIINYAIE